MGSSRLAWGLGLGPETDGRYERALGGYPGGLPGGVAGRAGEEVFLEVGGPEWKRREPVSVPEEELCVSIKTSSERSSRCGAADMNPT